MNRPSQVVNIAPWR